MRNIFHILDPDLPHDRSLDMKEKFFPSFMVNHVNTVTDNLKERMVIIYMIKRWIRVSLGKKKRKKKKDASGYDTTV